MTQLPPPPPPPAPPSAGPWYRSAPGLILLGLIAAGGAVVLYLMVRDGGDGVAAATTVASSTTSPTTTLPTTATSSTPATTSPPSTVAATTSTTTATATTTTTTTTTTIATVELDFSLPANYGEYSLASGFVPDPDTHSVISGGTVDASYLGGGCYGYATAAPDLKINYTAGAFPTLRFYFVPDVPGDTVLVVNTPGGSYVCNDDSFGTLNPTVDFNSPSGGRYDIWVASVTEGANHAGTLYVTENTGNHP